MLSFTKIRKRLVSPKDYKIIKKFNKCGNVVSYKSEVDAKTTLEGKNEIGESSIKNTNIGICSIIGSGCELNNCKIGSFTSISSSVRIVSARHPLNFVSTYSGFYNGSKPRFPYSDQHFEEYLTTNDGFSCEIGNDVWIGRNVLIKGGIVIGDGAVIGMGSVVTKDVPPYSVVAGVPARILRYRFSEKQIEALLMIRWWKWPLEKIEKRKEKFTNIEKFIAETTKF